MNNIIVSIIGLVKLYALLMVPLAIFKKTRRFAARGLIFSACFFGFCFWFWTISIASHYWGMIGAVIGVIVTPALLTPIVLIAAACHGAWMLFGLIIVRMVFIIGMFFAGSALNRE
jgi:hypothetical protein